MRVERGKRYKARLGGIPFFGDWSAEVDTALVAAGFSDVKAYKSGGDWFAEGTWNRDSLDIDAFPSHIVEVWAL